MNNPDYTGKSDKALLCKGLQNTHLHDLTLIVKSLYPHRDIVNPYKYEIESHPKWFASQKRLLIALMESLTLLNQKYREERQYGELVANHEDFVTALFLMEGELEVAKPLLLLHSFERSFYRQIWEEFGQRHFSCREAMAVSGLSKTRTWWKLKELKSKGFVAHVGSRGQAHLYKVKLRTYAL